MINPLTNSPPAPLFAKRGVTHMLRYGVSSENEFHNTLKEPQSGAIFIEESTPIYPSPLFEKLPFRNELQKGKILCIGEVLWDNLPDGKKPGGAPMNVAVHLHNLGHTVTMVSRVGNDESGRELLGFLKDSGLDTRFIEMDETLPTSQVLVHLDRNSNATYEICEPVAWDNLTLSDALVKKAGECGLMVYGSLASRNSVSAETILQLLDSEGIKLMDVNLRKPYDQKDIVEKLLLKSDMAKLNENELYQISLWNGIMDQNEKNMIMSMSRNYGLSLVCVTKGEKGAVMFCEGEFYEDSGFKVEAVDTVGAGDAFLAGLVSALMEGKGYGESLTFACAMGALVASKAGATPRVSREEIERMLSARGTGHGAQEGNQRERLKDHSPGQRPGG